MGHKTVVKKGREGSWLTCYWPGWQLLLASLHLDGIVLRMEVSHLDGISYSLSCSDGLFCRMEFSQWMGPQSGWFFLGWVFKSGWFSPQDGLLAVDGFFLGWSSRSGWFFLGWTSRSGWFFLGWTFRSGWFSPQDGLLAVDGFLRRMAFAQWMDFSQWMDTSTLTHCHPRCWMEKIDAGLHRG